MDGDGDDAESDDDHKGIQKIKHHLNKTETMVQCRKRKIEVSCQIHIELKNKRDQLRSC